MEVFYRLQTFIFTLHALSHLSQGHHRSLSKDLKCAKRVGVTRGARTRRLLYKEKNPGYLILRTSSSIFFRRYKT